MSALNVAIVQSYLHWHDPMRNREEFSSVLLAHDEPVDLFILPEMFTTGFSMHATTHAERMDGRSVRWMADTASSLESALCGSLIIEEDGHYYNRFILMRPDGEFACYDKRHRFRLAGEHEHYSAGNDVVSIELNGWQIRPMVCYDLRFPVWSRNRNDYDLLIYVANWPDRRHLAWETLIRARAIENLAYVAAVNRVGSDGNGIDYLGGSAIIDFVGKDLVAASTESTVMSATLEKSQLETFREKFPFHLDADTFTITDQKAR